MCLLTAEHPPSSSVTDSVMNPYRDTNLNPLPCDGVPAPGSASPQSPPDLHDSQNPSLSSSPSPPVVQTGRSSVTVLSHAPPPYQASSDPDGGQNLVQVSDRSTALLPASDPGFSLRSRPPSSPAQSPSQESAPTLNPYPAPAPPLTSQVSVIILSPDLRPSPLHSQCSEDSCPDLECSICFSQFNNVFRCPKMLQCKHTFCLECLARINIKSLQPNAIQCPLCRSLTSLPVLGLPRLATDSAVLSYLPAAMQRVYSIRFLRSKGKLQVKRSSEGQRWGHRSLRPVNRSLDVGVPSPPVRGRSEAGGVGGALFRLTGQPACRAFLLTSVVMMMVLLMGIIIFLIIFRKDADGQ